MSEIKYVNTNDPNHLCDVLQAADQPHMLLLPHAHGGHPEPTGKQLPKEAVLVPASWFAAVEQRLAALEKQMTRNPFWDAAAETPPPTPEEAEAMYHACFPGQKDAWGHFPLRPPIGTGVAQSTFGIEADDRRFDLTKTGLLGRSILCTREELEGLDKQGFRQLLKEKLNAVYLELMREWEGRDGNQS